MKIKLNIFIIIILFIICRIIISNKKSNGEVIGESSYEYCLEECYQEHHIVDWPREIDCTKSKGCSQCVDRCYNELKNNAPDIAKKLNVRIGINKKIPSGKCFINNIRDIE